MKNALGSAKVFLLDQGSGRWVQGRIVQGPDVLLVVLQERHLAQGIPTFDLNGPQLFAKSQSGRFAEFS